MRLDCVMRFLSEQRPDDRKESRTVNTLMRRTLLLPAILAMLTAGVAACKTNTVGEPSASTDPTSAARPTLPRGGGTNTGPRSTIARLNPTDSPIRSTEPCTLLTASEVTEIGAGPGKRNADTSSGTSRSCEFVASGNFNLRVIIFDVLGTKDVQATGEIKTLPPIGKHQAVQGVFGTACAVSVAVSATSRVDAVVSADGNTSKGCEIAMQVARLVEPKLPGGS
jgi:hypothetical protein